MSRLRPADLEPIAIYLPDDVRSDSTAIPPGSGIVGERKGRHLSLFCGYVGAPHRDLTTWADRLHTAWLAFTQVDASIQRTAAGWAQAGVYDPLEGKVLDVPDGLGRLLAAWLGYYNHQRTPQLELYTSAVPEHQQRRQVLHALGNPDARAGSALHQELLSFCRVHGHGDLMAGPRSI